MNRSEWLAQVREAVLEPERPIVDPHHHLWDDGTHPYLLPQLLDDVGSGHDVVAIVFVECSAVYRADGPQAFAPDSSSSRIAT